jgi:hemoglobin
MELPLSHGDQWNPAGHGFSAERTPFEAMGGLARVRDLVDRFYDHMEHDAAFAATRALYPPGDLSSSREKLFEFLAGWMGGPQLYVQKHGHPRLRARHLPFAIGETARDHWLTCMRRAMNEMKIDGELRTHFDQRFAHVADFLRNR